MDFFKSHRVLRKGCPLSPLLFLLVVEGLSRMLKKVVSEGKFSGLKVARGAIISHLCFVDDVLILGVGSVEEWMEFKKILTSFCLASGMEINCQKSCFLAHNLEEELLGNIAEIFEIPFKLFGSRYEMSWFSYET